MAVSKCMKCDSTTFEMKQAGPKNSAFYVQFIQCASCGGVVGVMEMANTGVLLEKLAKKLGVTL